MHSFKDWSGRWHHVFHQSDLGDYLMCPEKLRTKKDYPNTGSDATAIGTGVHLGIETWLLSDGQESYDVCWQNVQASITNEWETVRHIQTGTLDEALGFAEKSFKTFWSNRQNFPLGGEVEKQFQLPGVYRDQFRVIDFRGTIDYLVGDMIFDWKASAQSYKVNFWKTERYAVQPSMYTFAVAQLLGKTVPFTFVRLPKDGTALEMATVKRGPSQWSALIYMAVNLATLIESQSATWPIRPDDWWCSAKWCETHRNGLCMGQFLNGQTYNAPWTASSEGLYANLINNTKSGESK